MARNNDTKHLFKRGGVWWVQIMRDGKRHQETTGEADLGKARERRDELLAVYLHRDKAEAVASLQGKIDHHLALARKLEEAGKPGLPLAGLWTRWTDTAPTASPVTLRQYEIQIAAFCQWVTQNHPEATVAGVSPDMASAFVRHLEGMQRTANTINKYVGLMRKVWADIMPERLNPWAKIERRRGEVVSRRPLTKAELAEVLGRSDPEMRVLFLLGALLALRLGDAALLKWNQVDLGRGMIVVKPRKSRTRTGKTLAFPIIGALKNALGNLPKGKPDAYVMPTLATEYLRHGACLTDRIQQMFIDCGITTKAAREGGGRNAVEVGFHSLGLHGCRLAQTGKGSPQAQGS